MFTEIVLIFASVRFIGTSLQCPAQDTKDSRHFSGGNIAYRMQANQTPNMYENGKFPAGFAVDGNCDQNFNDGNSCSHTKSNNGISPTWTVQFGRSYNVTGIVIFNRHDLRWRLEHFTVTGNCSKKLDRLLYNDAENRKYTQSIILIELDGIYSCSSISIHIPQDEKYCESTGNCEPKYLTLCEVQVYAAGCSQPSVPSGNFYPSKRWYAQHETLTVQCMNGYKASSNQTVTCCAHETFCDQIPHCEIVSCQLPAHPENGFYYLYTDAINMTVKYGSKIVGNCNDGYKVNIVNTERQCQGDATWNGVDTVCFPVRCTQPENVTNGYYMYANDSRYFGDSEVYNTSLFGVCNTGYKLQTNSEIYCDRYGLWNGPKPTCAIVTCNRPAVFENGYYDFNNKLDVHSYGGELNAICKKGFTLKSIQSKRICNALGNWSGDSPVCIQIKCPWPLNLIGGYYTPSIEAKNTDNLPYNTTITAICNDGYSLNNSVTSRHCNEDGTWSYSPPICIDVKKDSGGKASSLGMIVGVSTGAVIVLVAVTAAMIIIYRKRRANTKPNKEYNDIKPTKNETEGEYVEIKETSFDQPGSRKSVLSKKGVYANVKSDSCAPKQDYESTTKQDASSQDASSHAYYSFQTKNGIPKSALKIENLSDIVLKGDTAKNRFMKEFEKLPEGMVEEHKDARKAENIGKNRYRHLFAYDHSRVVLEKEHKEQSDYINACYVNGYSKARAYIASQGPTEDILNDFWRMIWQTDCGKIVMLTNLVEENKSKCTQYWPDDGEVVHGDVSVIMQKSESFSEFVIRTFTLKKHNCKPKHVTQFHFTAWPDKGVPKYASSLVQFRNKVKYAPTRRHGPIVVHCSAGVGRTGTFIALDFLTDQAKDVGYVDVFGSVEGMRRQRVNLVQTLDQYIFLHNALVETLMLSTSATPSNQFPEWLKSMLQIDHRKKKRKLDIEFETLSRLSPSAEECQYFTAKQIRNRKKNRYSNVLPVDDFMPHLEPLGDTQSDSTYINAVFLPSYKEKNAFIITQTPLEVTKDDFWRLVWEHDIHVIVMMNSIHETSRAEQYWPNDSESIMSHNVTIKHTKTEEIKNHKVLTLSLQKYVVSRNVVQVQCGGWQINRSLPDSKDDMLSLLEIVQSLQRKTGNQSVLVHCMNGADKSGLFCVISAVIERMKIEQDVAITHVVEEMRNAREQIIPTMEQYKLCHDVVLAYIEDFSTYSNFSL